MKTFLFCSTLIFGFFSFLNEPSGIRFEESIDIDIDIDSCRLHKVMLLGELLGEYHYDEQGRVTRYDFHSKQIGFSFYTVDYDNQGRIKECNWYVTTSRSINGDSTTINTRDNAKFFYKKKSTELTEAVYYSGHLGLSGCEDHDLKFSRRSFFFYDSRNYINEIVNFRRIKRKRKKERKYGRIIIENDSIGNPIHITQFYYSKDKEIKLLEIWNRYDKFPNPHFIFRFSFQVICIKETILFIKKNGL